MPVKTVKVIVSGDGKIDKGAIVEAIEEAIPDNIEAESESDDKPEDGIDCEKCSHKDECSDEKKSKHKAAHEALSKGYAFRKSLHAVIDTIKSGKADRNEFADKLDK